MKVLKCFLVLIGLMLFGFVIIIIPQIWPGLSVSGCTETSYSQVTVPRNTIISTEVTIVTAFFNIGSFETGDHHEIRGPDHYRKWIQVFQSLDNPLVAFTDDKNMYDTLVELRKKFPSNRSKIFLIDKSMLWSFSVAQETRAIFKQPKYPKLPPNTVNENYSCVTHAKFELVQRVIKEGFFHAKYLAWVDIGLYRDHKYSELFHVKLVPNHNESKVAFPNVQEFINLPTAKIMKGSVNWVAAGMFMGRWDTLLTFTEDYLHAVQCLLDHKLMNAEQQVIYSMYSETFYFTPRVQIQTFSRKPKWDLFGLCELTRVKGPSPRFTKHS